MKKIIAILLILIMVFSLASCAPQDYKYAIKLYEEGDYQQALVFFEANAKYKDSFEKLTECKYYLAKMAMSEEKWADACNYLLDLDYLDSKELLDECYMHTNLDYAFLAEVEQLVTFRLNQFSLQEKKSNGEEYNEEELVSSKDLARTEYASIVRYNLEPFYNEELKEQSLNLEEGLKLRVQALEETLLSLSQSKSYQADYLITSSLCYFNENFGFMEGDESFKKEYTDKLEDSKKNYEASVLIQEDLDKQFSKLSATTGTPFKKEYNYLNMKVVNNTTSQYTLTIGMSFIDKTGITYETQEIAHTMKPNETYTFKFRINSTTMYQTHSYDYSYKDIA